MRCGHDILKRATGDCETTVHSSDLALVEDISASAETSPSGVETAFRILLPYFGFFALSVGDRRLLCDPNQTLFLSPGLECRTDHPVDGLGHAALVITPSMELLCDMLHGLRPRGSVAFMEIARPSTSRLALLTHRLRSLPRECDGSLYADELTVQLLHKALEAPSRGDRSSLLVDRAKQLLSEQDCDRHSLQEIARQVGASAVYLTQEFSRSEGIPLYKYQLRLRLKRALLELPHCDDITGLALDLGFSSHSHFTAMFRSAFGMTPSAYRSSTSAESAGAISWFVRPRAAA